MNPNQQNIRQLLTPEKVESEFLRDKKSTENQTTIKESVLYTM